MKNKKKISTKSIFSIIACLIAIALIGGFIYCMVNDVFDKSFDKQSSIVVDGSSATFTGLKDTNEIYINQDKSVYAELATELDGLDSNGYLMIFTNKQITKDMTEDETSEAIIMIARFAKADSGYNLILESLIDNFGTKQDVIIYSTADERFYDDTSIMIGEDGKLSMSLDFIDKGLTETVYCYLPHTCGCAEKDTVTEDFINRIFAIKAFENNK